MNPPQVFLYDKSFDGFLTCLYESYKQKVIPREIIGPEDSLTEFWDAVIRIDTHEIHAERVWRGMLCRMTQDSADRLFRMHYSGIQGIDICLFRVLRKIFDTGPQIAHNYADPDVASLRDMENKVNREACRVAQFVRFQKTADQIYFAAYAPQYDVIPSVLHHFQDRFADQKWMIYDMRRKKGYYFDGTEVQWVNLKSEHLDPVNGKLDPSILAPDEICFQDLWKQYFHSICIKERRNLKLHTQKIPKKYWKYLTEKQD